MNTQEILKYKEVEAKSFASKLTNNQVWDRAGFYSTYWKTMQADMEILLHEFIITNWETKEQVENVKKWASMLLNFYKACYNLEQNKKKLEGIKTKNTLQSQ